MPETRVLGAKVGLSCEFGGGSHFELIKAAQQILQFGDPALKLSPLGANVGAIRANDLSCPAGGAGGL